MVKRFLLCLRLSHFHIKLQYSILLQLPSASPSSFRRTRAQEIGCKIQLKKNIKHIKPDIYLYNPKYTLDMDRSEAFPASLVIWISNPKKGELKRVHSTKPTMFFVSIDCQWFYAYCMWTNLTVDVLLPIPMLTAVGTKYTQSTVTWEFPQAHHRNTARWNGHHCRAKIYLVDVKSNLASSG